MALNRGGKAPLTWDYHPKLDASDPLDTQEALYYQSLIGILHWAVEMGRMDITTEVSIMSSFVAMPREGHLQQLYHLFAYLEAHHNTRVVFDGTVITPENCDYCDM